MTNCEFNLVAGLACPAVHIAVIVLFIVLLVVLAFTLLLLREVRGLLDHQSKNLSTSTCCCSRLHGVQPSSSSFFPFSASASASSAAGEGGFSVDSNTAACTTDTVMSSKFSAQRKISTHLSQMYAKQSQALPPVTEDQVFTFNYILHLHSSI